jgi:hypothetical protein
MELAQAHPVSSTQSENIPATEIIHQTEAVLLDQRDDAAQTATIGQVRPAGEDALALLHGCV